MSYLKPTVITAHVSENLWTLGIKQNGIFLQVCAGSLLTPALGVLGAWPLLL